MAGIPPDSWKGRMAFLALLLLLFLPLLLLGHVSAQELEVALTSSPSAVQAGQAAQVQVLILYQGNPMPDAIVTVGVTPALATLSPSTGATDGSGRFQTTLSVDPSATEPLLVTASAVWERILIARPGTITYTGQGSLAISVTPIPPPRINQAPVAQFSAFSSGGPRTFTLNAGASSDPDGAIVSYLWDFGDGSQASGPVVTYTFSGGGEYPVTLTVTDNEGGRSIFSQPVSVAFAAPPIPVPVASPDSGPAPLTVSFSGRESYDPDGTIALYAWNFGDGTSGQGPTVSHFYRAPGTYQATLTVTDMQGLTGVSAITITAYSQLTPRATAAPPTTVATPTPVPTIGIVHGGDTWPGIADPHPLLGGILPFPVLFFLSMLAGTAVAALSTLPATQGISRRLDKGEESAKDYLSSTASSLINRLEATRRKLGPVIRGDPVLFGLTARELAVFFFCAGAYALAFLLKDRLQISPGNLLILVVAGAITTLAHQLGHHEAARRTGQTAELQFWGLGTAMLVLSAWIFGYLFASPSRNLFQKGPDLSPRTIAMVNLAGPAMSVAVAMASLLLLPLGGLAAFAGQTLFTMNLLNGVYSLVPFDPMDGKAVFDWNRSVWAAVFFPLLAVYAAVYLL